MKANNKIKTLLEQYANRTISKKDRFFLEKQALDDDFLFEALEGLSSDFNHKSNIDNIKSKLDSHHSIWIKIAASILVLLLSGSVLWYLTGTLKNTKPLITEKIEKKEPQKIIDNNNTKEFSRESIIEDEEDSIKDEIKPQISNTKISKREKKKITDTKNAGDTKNLSESTESNLERNSISENIGADVSIVNSAEIKPNEFPEIETIIITKIKDKKTHNQLYQNILPSARSQNKTEEPTYKKKSKRGQGRDGALDYDYNKDISEEEEVRVEPEMGISAFNFYINSNSRKINYLDHSKSGEVEIEFFVHKNGSISNVNVINFPNKDLEKEALKLLKESGRWKIIGKGDIIKTNILIKFF